MASKGWTWRWQRCGRYEYRKVLMPSTNPDHPVPSAPRRSGGLLRVAARYARGGSDAVPPGEDIVRLGKRSGTPTSA